MVGMIGQIVGSKERIQKLMKIIIKIISQFPHLDKEDVKENVIKMIGLYITWLEDHMIELDTQNILQSGVQD